MAITTNNQFSEKLKTLALGVSGSWLQKTNLLGEQIKITKNNPKQGKLKAPYPTKETNLNKHNHASQTNEVLLMVILNRINNGCCFSLSSLL